MRKTSITIVLAAVMTMGFASIAMADGPTCSEFGFLNHGEHVVEDYVTQGEPGARGGPAHFGAPVGPGASFCLEQAQAESPSGPPGS